MTTTKQKLYRVKFLYKDEKKPLQVVVSNVQGSDFFGLICLEGFLFSDQTKHVIMPEEDQARRKFSQTERLHLPYHNIIFIEEFYELQPDLKKLPFLKNLKDKE